MNAPFYKRIELAFWDFTINTLSENDRVRRLVMQTAATLRGPQFARLIGVTTASAFAGLAGGVFLFILLH